MTEAQQQRIDELNRVLIQIDEMRQGGESDLRSLKWCIEHRITEIEQESQEEE